MRKFIYLLIASLLCFSFVYAALDEIDGTSVSSGSTIDGASVDSWDGVSLAASSSYPTRVGWDRNHAAWTTALVLSNFTIANADDGTRMVVCGWALNHTQNTSSLAMESERAGPTKLEEEDVSNLVLSLWYWDDNDLPAAAGDYDVTATATGNTEQQIHCIEINGADQTINAADHESNSTETDDQNCTVTFTTPANNSLVIGYMGIYEDLSGDHTGADGFTIIHQNSPDKLDLALGYEEVATAGSNTITTTYSGETARSNAVGVALDP